MPVYRLGELAVTVGTGIRHFREAIIHAHAHEPRDQNEKLRVGRGNTHPYLNASDGVRSRSSYPLPEADRPEGHAEERRPSAGCSVPPAPARRYRAEEAGVFPDHPGAGSPAPRQCFGVSDRAW